MLLNCVVLVDNFAAHDLRKAIGEDISLVVSVADLWVLQMIFFELYKAFIIDCKGRKFLEIQR